MKDEGYSGLREEITEEGSYCMRPEQQVTRSHLPQGQQGPLWAGGRKVGNYTNSEEAVPEDTFFGTPFEGTGIRDDGTAGIVEDDEEYTGIIRPFGKRLPVEAGRYVLIWTPFCPWATRAKITLNLLGISEDIIRTVKVNPVKTEDGWIFEEPLKTEDRLFFEKTGEERLSEKPLKRDDEYGRKDGRITSGGKIPCESGISTLTELYEKTAPGQSWSATVPALLDGKTGMIVNNDYHRLPHYFETVWRSSLGKEAPDLYPVRLRSQIDRLNRVLFNDIGSRVYTAGYARMQEDYEHSFYIFFNRLDWLDRYLGRHRFLMGDSITDPDIRLYAALARLDEAYYFAFRLNGMRLQDYDNLWRYARELYAMPAFREATDFEAIKRGYYLGPGASNPFRIVPDGPEEAEWAF